MTFISFNAFSGQITSELQKFLNKKGYSVGTPDGKIGKNTIKGIKKFQKDNNLKPDGKISIEFIQKLTDDNEANSTCVFAQFKLANAHKTSGKYIIQAGAKDSAYCQYVYSYMILKKGIKMKELGVDEPLADTYERALFFLKRSAEFGQKDASDMLNNYLSGNSKDALLKQFKVMEEEENSYINKYLQ